VFVETGTYTPRRLRAEDTDLPEKTPHQNWRGDVQSPVPFSMTLLCFASPLSSRPAMLELDCADSAQRKFNHREKNTRRFWLSDVAKYVDGKVGF